MRTKVKQTWTPPIPGSRRIFPGWWVVFGATVSSILASGFYFFGFSAFFLPLQEEFHTSRAALSGAVSMGSLMGLVLWPLQGMAIDRFGPSRVALVGIVLTGTGLIVMSLAHSLLHFYIVQLFLISPGVIIGFSVAGHAAVANWFVKKRGIAMGIVTSGVGVGTILVSLVAWMVAHLGWHEAAVISGVAVLAFGAPSSLLLLRRPEAYGLLPDGAKAQAASSTEVSAGDGDFTAMEALKTRAFWLAVTAFALRIVVGAGLGLHFIPLMVSKGYSEQTAAALMAAWGIISVPGRLGFGWLADKYNIKYVSAATTLVMAVSMVVLLGGGSMWQVAVFLLLFGTSFGGHVSVMQSFWGDYFGRKAYATISAFALVFSILSNLLGPFLAGFIYDSTKSYDISLILFGACSLLATVLMLLVRRPTLKRA